MLAKIQNLPIRARKAISIIFFSAVCAGEIVLIFLAEYLMWKLSHKDLLCLMMVSSFTLPVFLTFPIVSWWERIHIVMRSNNKA